MRPRSSGSVHVRERARSRLSTMRTGRLPHARCRIRAPRLPCGCAYLRATRRAVCRSCVRSVYIIINICTGARRRRERQRRDAERCVTGEVRPAGRGRPDRSPDRVGRRGRAGVSDLAFPFADPAIGGDGRTRRHPTTPGVHDRRKSRFHERRNERLGTSRAGRQARARHKGLRSRDRMKRSTQIASSRAWAACTATTE